MKQALFAALLIGNIFSSFSQTQIPNGDFENWTISTYCSEMDSVDNFLNAEAFTYLNTKKILGSASCPASSFQYQSTDKQSGNYALKLGSLDNNIYYNFVLLGKAKDYGMQGITSVGIPFSGRPTKLTGYYKYTNGADGDELKIEVVGSNITAANYLFYGKFITSIDQTIYKKFEINLEYDATDLNNAMLLTLLITAGNPHDGTINENTVALIDNLIFEYATPTATTTYTSTTPINVYAANKNINFSENVSDVYVVDMVGASKMQETGSTKIVHATSLTAGMYIVTYKYMDAYFSKKVIIE